MFQRGEDRERGCAGSPLCPIFPGMPLLPTLFRPSHSFPSSLPLKGHQGHPQGVLGPCRVESTWPPVHCSLHATLSHRRRPCRKKTETESRDSPVSQGWASVHNSSFHCTGGALLFSWSRLTYTEEPGRTDTLAELWESVAAP